MFSNNNNKSMLLEGLIKYLQRVTEANNKANILAYKFDTKL